MHPSGFHDSVPGDLICFDFTTRPMFSRYIACCAQIPQDLVALAALISVRITPIIESCTVYQDPGSSFTVETALPVSQGMNPHLLDKHSTQGKGTSRRDS